MTVLTAPKGMVKNTYCPGCGHGIVARMLHELFEELGYADNCCIVAGVGCCCNMEHIGNHDAFQCAHGRAASTATGMKRVLPQMLTVVYQGDGDGMVIGLGESLNAAYRNENITVFMINNTNFGMTGGQMSWTTLEGEVTVTSVHGRDCEKTGKPMHYPEMVASNLDVAYVARGAVHNIANINKTKGYMRNALEAQIAGEGYSIVEILSPCPTNWHLSPQQAQKFLKEEVMAEYPVKEFLPRRNER